MVGLTPAMGGTQRLAERAGPARAKELVFTGELFDAATLERWNVVNRVSPDEGFDDAARAFAQQVWPTGRPSAHAATKRLVRGADGGRRARRRRARRRGRAAPLFATEDLAERGAVVPRARARQSDLRGTLGDGARAGAPGSGAKLPGAKGVDTVMHRRPILASAVVLAALALPTTASAAIIEVGKAGPAATPSCPKPCYAINHTTGFQSRVGRDRRYDDRPAGRAHRRLDDHAGRRPARSRSTSSTARRAARRRRGSPSCGPARRRACA